LKRYVSVLDNLPRHGDIKANVTRSGSQISVDLVDGITVEARANASGGCGETDDGYANGGAFEDPWLIAPGTLRTPDLVEFGVIPLSADPWLSPGHHMVPRNLA